MATFNLNRSSLIVLSLSALIISCTSNKDTDLDDIGRSAKNRDTIVRQADSNVPVVANKSRAEWVQIRKDTKSPETKLYATLATGSWDAAESEARALLQKQPNNGSALVVLATSLSMQKKYSLAAFYARAYEKAHGVNAEVLNLKGLSTMTQTKLNMVDLKEAAKYFNEAFQSDQSDIASGLNLGHLYLEIGDSQSAADTFAEVKNRCGNCVPALIGSGVAHSRLRNFAAARNDFELTLKKHKHHPQALYRLAQITYQGDKNSKRAKKYIDELMTYAPEKDYLVRQKAEALVRAMDAEDDMNDIPSIAADNDKAADLKPVPVSSDE